MLSQNIAVVLFWLCGLQTASAAGIFSRLGGPGRGHAAFHEQRRQQEAAHAAKRSLHKTIERRENQYLSDKTEG
jgi:hypothetical protein